jgi:hypothetical protein
MFVGKALGAYPRVEHLKGNFTQVGSDHPRKHYTRLERPVGDKHFSLLQKLVNYRHKNVYTIVPSFLGYQALFPFITERISCSVCPCKHKTRLERSAREKTLAYYENSIIPVIKSL